MSAVKQKLGRTQKHLGNNLQKHGSKRFGPRTTRKNKKTTRSTRNNKNIN